MKMARNKMENPPHWYFPISYKEMHRRRMKNIDKALKKIGLTRKDLEKKYKNCGNRRKRNNKNGKRRRRGHE